MSALVLTDSMESQGASRHLCQASGQKAGRSLQCQAGRKQSQNPCSEKDIGKDPSLPYAQQCFQCLYSTLFKVRKDTEGPVLGAGVWGTLC